jgi:RNA polymerase sigma-70 factor, ECF subfamily
MAWEVGQRAVSRLAAAFAPAAQKGDVASLTKLLAGDAVLYSDGGGKRAAALNPIPLPALLF